jgi:hypothetical protein
MPRTKLGPIALLVLSASACGSSGGDPAASSVSSGEAVGRSQEALQCTGTTQITQVGGTAIPCAQLGDFSPSLMHLCTSDNGCTAVEADRCDGNGVAFFTYSTTMSYPCSLILLNCTSHLAASKSPKGPQGPRTCRRATFSTTARDTMQIP